MTKSDTAIIQSLRPGFEEFTEYRAASVRSINVRVAAGFGTEIRA
jgi:hypothetical protein